MPTIAHRSCQKSLKLYYKTLSLSTHYSTSKKQQTWSVISKKIRRVLNGIALKLCYITSCRYVSETGQRCWEESVNGVVGVTLTTMPMTDCCILLVLKNETPLSTVSTDDNWIRSRRRLWPWTTDRGVTFSAETQSQVDNTVDKPIFAHKESPYIHCRKLFSASSEASKSCVKLARYDGGNI